MAGTTTTHIAEWGVANNIATAVKRVCQGVVTSWEDSCDYKAGELFNEIGSQIGRDIYDFVHNVSCTVQTAHGVALPRPDAQITINGKTFWVKSARYSEQNRDYCKMSLQLMSTSYSNTGNWSITHVPVV